MDGDGISSNSTIVGVRFIRTHRKLDLLVLERSNGNINHPPTNHIIRIKIISVIHFLIQTIASHHTIHRRSSIRTGVGNFTILVHIVRIAKTEKIETHQGESRLLTGNQVHQSSTVGSLHSSGFKEEDVSRFIRTFILTQTLGFHLTHQSASGEEGGQIGHRNTITVTLFHLILIAIQQIFQRKLHRSSTISQHLLSRSDGSSSP